MSASLPRRLCSQPLSRQPEAASPALREDLERSFAFEQALRHGQPVGFLSWQERAYWRVGIAALWATWVLVRSSSIVRERITLDDAQQLEAVLSTWEYRRNDELQAVRDRLAKLQELFNVDYELYRAFPGGSR